MPHGEVVSKRKEVLYIGRGNVFGKLPDTTPQL